MVRKENTVTHSLQCALTCQLPARSQLTVVRMDWALCSSVTRTKGIRSGYLRDRSSFRKSDRVPDGVCAAFADQRFAEHHARSQSRCCTAQWP